ncbi:hypothetical protein [Microbacterium sp. MMO-10]|uniref:hypothetical protein n=1 Tax=Microbacterium sp. MMO-10 TaxID=3081272 RepID=UPI0030165766
MSRIPLRIGGEEVTEVLPPEVQRAIVDLISPDTDALADVLEPFGLEPIDIMVPVFYRVMYVDEAPIFSRLIREKEQRAADAASREQG